LSILRHVARTFLSAGSGDFPVARRCWSALLSALIILASAATAIAALEPPSQPVILPPEQAAKEGRVLAEEMVSQKPAANTTNAGAMTIRDADNNRTQIPVRFEVFTTPTNWCSRYKTTDMTVTVLHDGAKANQYQVAIPRQGRDFTATGQQLMLPFAGSDFAIADLGLEFFHWPEQHLTKKEMKRSRSCKVLESMESINPRPAAGGYSRVVSWIDNESDGIVMAQAYDSQGKLLKQFIPKKVEKVNGQWQLQEMEIDNAQTGSSTRVDFDLNTSK
jgi:YD repeat-containing protein